MKYIIKYKKSEVYCEHPISLYCLDIHYVLYRKHFWNRWKKWPIIGLVTLEDCDEFIKNDKINSDNRIQNSFKR